MAAFSPWAGLVAALLALPAACDLPRDPEGTLGLVQGGTLQVAVVAPGLTPDEAATLERLADSLDARVEFLDVDLHEAVAQLGASEPDGVRVTAVAGAIPAGTPFTSGAAATRPIGRERFVILLPPGENALLLAANRAVAAGAEGG